MSGKHFNLSAIIRLFDLSAGGLALTMFPDHKHPRRALQRVIEGEAFLDTRQLQLLADYIGVTIGDLFTYSYGWRSAALRDGIEVTMGEYSARLTTDKTIIVDYKGAEVARLSTKDNFLTLSQFLEMVEQYISNNLKTKKHD